MTLPTPVQTGITHLVLQYCLVYAHFEDRCVMPVLYRSNNIYF